MWPSRKGQQPPRFRRSWPGLSRYTARGYRCSQPPLERRAPLRWLRARPPPPKRPPPARAGNGPRPHQNRPSESAPSREDPASVDIKGPLHLTLSRPLLSLIWLHSDSPLRARGPLRRRRSRGARAHLLSSQDLPLSLSIRPIVPFLLRRLQRGVGRQRNRWRLTSSWTAKVKRRRLCRPVRSWEPPGAIDRRRLWRRSGSRPRATRQFFPLRGSGMKPALSSNRF